MELYDIVIVGAGPAGLTLAQCCSHISDNILVIDKEASIGGCHRVRRHQGLFTEHGPRVYSSTYKVLDQLLNEMDVKFNDLFTPYNFSIATIGGETIWSTLSFTEIASLGKSFISLLINDDHGIDTSMLAYMKNYNFKDESIDLIDRICRLTDGATAENYTLNEFLQLFNQQFFHTLYQPKKPNDHGLFKIWYEFLESQNVEFMLSTEVVSLNAENDTIRSLTVSKNNVEFDIFAKTVIIATPPHSLVNIVANSNIKDAFGDFGQLVDWSRQTAYIDYISITLHWDQKLDLPKVYGFPRSEWGLAFIVLSDYMTFQEDESKTVISTAITITDHKSNNIGKTANECTEQELLTEVLHQLKHAFPELPQPTISLLSPGVYYDRSLSRWVSKDTAFIASANFKTIPFKSNLTNLYNVGTHNGQHLYKFTSIESAVSNAMTLSLVLFPELKDKYKIVSSMTVRKFLIDFFIVCLIAIIIIYLM
jgi:hypothetical protein